MYQTPCFITKLGGKGWKSPLQHAQTLIYYRLQQIFFFLISSMKGSIWNLVMWWHLLSLPLVHEIQLINWMEVKWSRNSRCLNRCALPTILPIHNTEHWTRRFRSEVWKLSKPRLISSWEIQMNELSQGGIFCEKGKCSSQAPLKKEIIYRSKQMLMFTWKALLCRVRPARNVPSNRPIESVLRSKGDTKVTYFAPDQGFNRPIAHSSVSPPTLSKMTSNLMVQAQAVKFNKIFSEELLKHLFLHIKFFICLLFHDLQLFSHISCCVVYHLISTEPSDKAFSILGAGNGHMGTPSL